MSGQPRLLVVEDESDLVDSLKQNLEVQGYEVLTACDGQAALELVRREKLDLILLDLMLPKLDGYRVLKFLKSDERFRQIPILVTTARADLQDLTLALECGANATMVKPLKFDSLLESIQTLLSNANSVSNQIDGNGNAQRL